MAVVANVNSDAGVLGFKNRIAKIAGSKVKLLPESGMAVRDVMFAVFSQVAAVGIDDSGSIEINAGHLLLVNRNHNHHAMFGGDLLHQANRRPIGNALG